MPKVTSRVSAGQQVCLTPGHGATQSSPEAIRAGMGLGGVLKTKYISNSGRRPVGNTFSSPLLGSVQELGSVQRAEALLAYVAPEVPGPVPHPPPCCSKTGLCGWVGRTRKDEKNRAGGYFWESELF